MTLGPTNATLYWANKLLDIINQIESQGHEVSVEKDGTLRVWSYSTTVSEKLYCDPDDGWYRKVSTQ